MNTVSEKFVSTDSHQPGVTDFVHIGLVVEVLDETGPSARESPKA